MRLQSETDCKILEEGRECTIFDDETRVMHKRDDVEGGDSREVCVHFEFDWIVGSLAKEDEAGQATPGKSDVM